jgi:hypothetical protein
MFQCQEPASRKPDSRTCEPILIPRLDRRLLRYRADLDQLLASPDYIKAHGAPETPEELISHEALMQGTETWPLTDGDKVVTFRPQARFKADNGTALMAAVVAGLGIAYLPDGPTREFVESGALVPVMARYSPPTAGAISRGATTTCRDPSRYCSIPSPAIFRNCTCNTRGSAHSPCKPNAILPMTVENSPLRVSEWRDVVTERVNPRRR